MASKGDIIPRIVLDPCSNTVCAYVRSLEPRHWYLLWSLYPPAKTPVYKTIRGVTTRCGFRYSAAGWNCQEQEETGETTDHTFCFQDTPFNSQFHFAISETCNIASGFFTSAPMLYRFQECAPGAQAWRVTAPNTDFLPAPDTGIAFNWNQVIYDPANCLTLPSSVLRICGSNTYACRLHVLLRIQSIFPQASAVIGMHIQGQDDAVFGIQNVASGQSLEVTFERDIFFPNPGVTQVTPFAYRLGDFGIQAWATTSNRHWCSVQAGA